MIFIMLVYRELHSGIQNVVIWPTIFQKVDFLMIFFNSLSLLA
jgi:hypothetical protein